MGYYTDYEISVSVEDGAVDLEVVNSRISEISGYEFDSLESAGIKWYKHRDDMKQLSLEYPDVVFELHGVGEEQPDMWKKYFKNGKMQVCEAQISYPKYDASELK